MVLVLVMHLLVVVFFVTTMLILCAFAENISLTSAFMAELCGAMRAIEIVAHNN
jgi:hypothetical protein